MASVQDFLVTKDVLMKVTPQPLALVWILERLMTASRFRFMATWRPGIHGSRRQRDQPCQEGSQPSVGPVTHLLFTVYCPLKLVKHFAVFPWSFLCISSIYRITLILLSDIRTNPCSVSLTDSLRCLGCNRLPGTKYHVRPSIELSNLLKISPQQPNL